MRTFSIGVCLTADARPFYRAMQRVIELLCADIRAVRALGVKVW